MKINDMIAVLKAFSEGKTVQRTLGGNTGWHDVESDAWGIVEWDFFRFNWRIKPEPREWWITLAGQVWPTRDMARDWFKEDAEFNQRVIHVREVLDDSSVQGGNEAG